MSVKIVFLIHLIKGLAYPSDSRGRHRPDVYIWTWTIPAAAVVWGKLSLRSSFLRERFLKGRSRKRLLSKIIRLFPINYRSSHRRCSFKKAVISNFELFTGKKLVLQSIFNKVAGLKACNFVKKETQTPVFELLSWVSCEYCNIFRNIYSAQIVTKRSQVLSNINLYYTLLWDSYATFFARYSMRITDS